MTPETAATFLDATARSSGLAFTPAALAAAAEQLVASVERDAAGQFAFTPDGYASAFRIQGSETVEIPIGEHIAGIIRRNAGPIPKATPTTAQDAPSLTTEPAKIEVNTPIAEFGRHLAAQHAAEMAREAETWPNPWAKGQENRTRQNIIRNHDPALAARHRAQAGV